MIGDALILNVVSISRVFFLISQARIHQKSSSTIARKREKISNWSVQRWKSQVIKCPTNFIIEQLLEIVYSFTVKSKVFQKMIYIRQERANERYRNTVKDLLLPNTVSQKDEKPHTAGLDDTAIPHIKIKIFEIPFEKKLNTAIP